MKLSIIKGSSYGITSGIITTLGLIMGLSAGSGMRSIVLGGIFTIAVADAFSDSLGIHISVESEGKKTAKEVWVSTISCFIAKFIFAIQFIIPFIFLPLYTAVTISVIWGFFLLSVLSYYIARKNKDRPFPVISEHLLIAILVIIMTHFVGISVRAVFG